MMHAMSASAFLDTGAHFDKSNMTSLPHTTVKVYTVQRSQARVTKLFLPRLHLNPDLQHLSP